MSRAPALALVVLAGVGCVGDRECTPGLEVGECPPDLVLPDRDDYPVTLSELRRDVVLIELSAVW
jgi:hypothetical protein